MVVLVVVKKDSRVGRGSNIGVFIEGVTSALR